MSAVEEMALRYSEQMGIPVEALLKYVAHDIDTVYDAALHGVPGSVSIPFRSEYARMRNR